MNAYLVLDIGTHAAKAAVVDTTGHLSCQVEHPIPLHRLDRQRVEQNPSDILQAVWLVVRHALSETTSLPLAMGIAVQRSTVLAWNRETGEPLSQALSWQDTRCADRIAHLKQHESEVQARSGLVLSPHYGATKIQYLNQQSLLKNEIHQKELAISPLVSFVLFHLLEEHPYLCDESNAGRTQLWNINERHWDSKLLALFGVDEAVLPAVKPMCAHYGTLKESGMPVRAVAGDQNAALNAALTPQDNDKVLINLGSGAFLLNYCDRIGESSRLLKGVGYSDEARVSLLLEGTVNGAGTALTWLSQTAAFSALGGETYLFDNLETWLTENAQTPSQTLPVFINSVGGIGSPFWRTERLSEFIPPMASHEAQAVAVIESIVFLLVANLQYLQRLNPNIALLIVSGGVAQSTGLCQRLSFLSELPIARQTNKETTLYGAACLASGLSIKPQTSSLTFHPQDVVFDGLKERFEQFVYRIEEKI